MPPYFILATVSCLVHQGESTTVLTVHSELLRVIFFFFLYIFISLVLEVTCVLASAFFFSLLELGWEQMLCFIRIEEFGFILNRSRTQLLWWFWKEIFERNSILGNWYFVSLWSCIVIIQGSTLSKKVFWCEKSKLFIPRILKLDVSVFLTFSSLFFFWNTVMILQNISCLISFGSMEVTWVKAFRGCCFLFLQVI